MYTTFILCTFDRFVNELVIMCHVACTVHGS